MRIPGIKTAKVLARWFQARIIGGALILGYHRVSDELHDEYDVCVSQDHFTEHMDVLGKIARPIKLADLVRHLKDGSLPPKSVAVTFDDGYADNLYRAKPILEKNDIPATVFICTGYAGEEFWWDELERLVISSTADLSSFRLVVGKRTFKWDQTKMASGTVLEIRRRFHRALYHFLLPLDVRELKYSINLIRSWSGASSVDNATSRAMNHKEIVELAEGGLIQIGSHTRHHPLLPHLSLERQKDEIISGKQDLEDLLGRRVEGFAYPNGKATLDAKRLVRDTGFVFACTSLNNVVRRGSDIHELTRFWQKDVDGDRFIQGLRLWMKI